MLKQRCIKLGLISTALLVSVINNASAQTQSTSAIRGIGTGWEQDQIIAYTPASIPASSNPAGCTSPDGYGTRLTNAGYKTHLSTIQLAFALGKPITVTVSNGANDCIDGRPRIIGVTVLQ